MIVSNLARPGAEIIDDAIFQTIINSDSADLSLHHDTHSTGIGIRSATLSLRALGGDMHMWQDKGVVYCVLTLPIYPTEINGNPADNDEEVKTTPSTDEAEVSTAAPLVSLSTDSSCPNLVIKTLDDSRTITKMYSTVLPKYFEVPVVNVTALGLDIDHARNAVKHLMLAPDIIVLDQVRVLRIQLLSSFSQIFF